ncbi:hypothetical protein [Halobacteriovorax sp. HLS]|uniref:hypothetical protein n=1 Tax=Halobacteriovorax sp. HLS TaxID=2234000 RepID=UPI000FD87D44|nr:hypothetical protein [Halobacteriovorax sp. HLS]
MTKNKIEKFKDILPKEFFTFFSNELEKALKASDCSRLEEELVSLENTIPRRKNESEFFDEDKLNLLIEQSRTFLRNINNYDDETKSYILAAISYLINEDDAIEDSDKYSGFDDDYEVMKL